jgi:hypothetical protein
MIKTEMRVRTQRGSSVPLAGLASAAGAIHSCAEHSPLVVPVGVAVGGPLGEGFVTTLEQTKLTTGSGSTHLTSTAPINRTPFESFLVLLLCALLDLPFLSWISFSSHPLSPQRIECQLVRRVFKNRTLSAQRFMILSLSAPSLPFSFSSSSLVCLTANAFLLERFFHLKSTRPK